MKIAELGLTKKQLYKIRAAVDEQGYENWTGKKYALITQPIINMFRERLDIILLTPTQFRKTVKFFKQIGLTPKGAGR